MAAVIESRARQFKKLRALVMRQLSIRSTQPIGQSDPVVREAVVSLANTFTRYAQTQETAYDKTGGTGTISATSSANLMERQVSRALAQVLGKAPGSSPTSFINALNAAFPTMSNGKISSTPSRSAVSLYGQSDTAYNQGGYVPVEASAGLIGQISSEQAALYRQASVVAADALKILAGLQPFVPEAEMDKIEALRTLVSAEIKILVYEEFSRVDEPRPQRVDTYFDQLTGPNGHLIQFGERAFLDRRRVTPTTLDDETQVTGFESLKGYVGILRNLWNSYRRQNLRRDGSRPYSERVSRANVLLSVIAEGNGNFMSALDSIGFTENERRSSASKFTTLNPGIPKSVVIDKDKDKDGNPTIPITIPELPDFTVNDLTDWIANYSFESLSSLSDSGQYGLEFVTDQADSIFWVIVPILAFTRIVTSVNLNSMPILAQALTHERVSWALDDLVNQLNALADLAA